MSITSRRLEKGWTQEQLAEITGISARTVQRIEAGNPANLETLKCLAAVFEANVADLIEEQQAARGSQETDKMNTETNDYLEADALKYVKNLKEFYKHLVVFIIVVPCLIAFNSWLTPGVWWVVWAIGPWGFAVAMHFLTVFGFLKFFGPNWEQQQFKKRMRSHQENSTKIEALKK